MQLELVLNWLLNNGYEVCSRKVDDIYEVRLTGPLGSTTMIEANDLSEACYLAAEQVGFDLNDC
jgi:hypothetical protein